MIKITPNKKTDASGDGEQEANNNRGRRTKPIDPVGGDAAHQQNKSLPLRPSVDLSLPRHTPLHRPPAPPVCAAAARASAAAADSTT
jgi:hypothetical protein